MILSGFWYTEYDTFYSMLNSFFDASSINYFVAYLAGFVTFFASCLLPLVPTYLAYLSGVSLQSEASQQKRWKIFRASAFFVAGFVVTFVILGIFMNRIGSPVQAWRPIIERLAGALFVFLGLYIMGAFSQSWMNQDHRLRWSDIARLLFGKTRSSKLEQWIDKHTFVHSFLVGIGFAFGWTPCIGPVLAVILLWAGHAESIWSGASLLLAYGLGLGTPFLITGLLFDRLIPVLRRSQRFTKYIQYIAGGIVILSGLLLATGQFQSVSLFLIKIFNLPALAA